MSNDGLAPCMTRRSTGMVPLRPPANLSAALVHRLAEEIRAGRLAPGGRLPTEQDLMREAGVSRTADASCARE